MSKYQVLLPITVSLVLCIITILLLQYVYHTPASQIRDNIPTTTTTEFFVFDENLRIPDATDITKIKNHRNIGLINHPSCGLDATNKVYPGKNAHLFQFKWNAMLYFINVRNNMLNFGCGGSLIADQYVLSAAHCVISVNSVYKLHSVRLGEHDLNTELDCIMNSTVCSLPVQEIKVESYKIHEMYDDSQINNEIMLIKLEHSVKYVKNIKTICLPTNENELITKSFEKEQLAVTGWGKAIDGSKSNVMLIRRVPLISLKSCYSLFPRKVNPGQVCAGGAAISEICEGDSGSPLTGGINTIDNGGNIKPKTFQFGIVSYGKTCGDENAYPDVYTNVAYYMQWILDQMD
ncbi:unnamed protein product [Diamesa serratosioi]